MSEMSLGSCHNTLTMLERGSPICTCATTFDAKSLKWREGVGINAINACQMLQDLENRWVPS